MNGKGLSRGTSSQKVFFEGLGPCFNIEFAQLKVMPKTRNKSVEIVAVVTHVKNKKSKKQPFRICLSVMHYIICLS